MHHQFYGKCGPPSTYLAPMRVVGAAGRGPPSLAVQYELLTKASGFWLIATEAFRHPPQHM